MGRLEGKVAVVTGAASGIGAATVERFVAEGATVAGLDLAAAPASPAATFLASVDVRDETQVATAVADVVARHGRIDALVHAAGVAGAGPVHQLAATEWDRVLDVNLKGTFLVDKHVIARMLEQEPREGERGSVVNIASIEGLVGTEGGSAYNASKGGVVILTKNLAIDYGRRGIRVNCICPGFVETPMTQRIFELPGLESARESFAAAHQLGRMGRPEEIAAAGLFLVSSDASFVTGHALVVDGGYVAGQRHGISELMGLA